MIRITASGGRVIIMGPVGEEAARGDRWLLATFRRRGPVPDWTTWLEEHIANGLPTCSEILNLLESPRVGKVGCAGYLTLRDWRIMHLAAMRGPRLGPAHGLVWGSFARVARRRRQGPFYRWMFVADLT
jgi:hypothetical protein